VKNVMRGERFRITFRIADFLWSIMTQSSDHAEMKQALAAARRVLFLKWILATTLGWWLGWGLAGEVGAGLAIGAAQWLVLRPVLSPVWGWIAATAFGWLAGLALMLTGMVIPPGATFLAGALIGVLSGGLQWFLLQKFGPRANWWAVANAIGWGLGYAGLLGMPLVGAVAGAIGGAALNWILGDAILDV